MGENWKHLFSNQEGDKGVTLPTLIQYNSLILSAVKQEKEIKGIQIWKEVNYPVLSKIWSYT
jgi:hypothetical protein